MTRVAPLEHTIFSPGGMTLTEAKRWAKAKIQKLRCAGTSLTSPCMSVAPIPIAIPTMPETTLFQGRDYIDRRWLITARPGPDAVAIVTFTCWNSNGRSKALDQTAAWSPDGWDMCRPWFPASPRPVPELILARVQKKLQELVK